MYKKCTSFMNGAKELIGLISFAKIGSRREKEVKRKTVKIIYFDIDGTLREESRGVSEKVKEMIRLCKEEGIYTVMCTGRNRGSIQQDIWNLKIDGSIYSGGCCIEFQGKLLQKQQFEYSQIDNFIRKSKILRIGLVLETEEWVYMNGQAAAIYENIFKEKTKTYSNKKREQIKKQNHFLYEDNMGQFKIENDVFKVCIIGDKKKLECIKSEMENKCSIVQFIPFGECWLLEYLPKECDKGNAVMKLNRFLKIKKEESSEAGRTFN